MKLSDIKGERTFDVIADLIEPIANIAEDKAAMGLFDRKKPDGMTPEEFAISKAKKGAPALIRDHKNDLISIFSTIKGVSEEEYVEGLSLGSLLKDLYELMTDEDLLGFLS